MEEKRNAAPLSEERDWLTGLLNRDALVRRINEALGGREGGLLLLLDLDHFKLLNDRYGHMLCDRLLQNVARVLGYLAARKDILGRVDGNRFAVFLSGDYPRPRAEERTEQIRQRLRQAGEPLEIQEPLRVTIGSAVSRADEDAAHLLDRANRSLLAAKRKRAQHNQEAGDDSCDDIRTDMRLIHLELQERETAPGACCQDYETFKQIYRFVDRALERSQLSAYILLLTLTGGEGSFLPLETREQRLDQLRVVIQYALRRGDVYTPYSSCQFLVMALGASRENAAEIGRRICSRMQEQAGGKPDYNLQCDVYPLRPGPAQDSTHVAAGHPLPM